MKKIKGLKELKNSVHDFISCNNANLLGLSREELTLVRRVYELKKFLDKHNEK